MATPGGGGGQCPTRMVVTLLPGSAGWSTVITIKNNGIVNGLALPMRQSTMGLGPQPGSGSTWAGGLNQGLAIPPMAPILGCMSNWVQWPPTTIIHTTMPGYNSKWVQQHAWALGNTNCCQWANAQSPSAWVNGNVGCSTGHQTQTNQTLGSTNSVQGRPKHPTGRKVVCTTTTIPSTNARPGQNNGNATSCTVQTGYCQLCSTYGTSQGGLPMGFTTSANWYTEQQQLGLQHHHPLTTPG